jgi:hypothetical protein
MQKNRNTARAPIRFSATKYIRPVRFWQLAPGFIPDRGNHPIPKGNLRIHCSMPLPWDATQ